MASDCSREGLDRILEKNIFTEGVAKHWNAVPREVVGSLSLEMFKRYVDVTLGDMVYW